MRTRLGKNLEKSTIRRHCHWSDHRYSNSSIDFLQRPKDKDKKDGVELSRQSSRSKFLFQLVKSFNQKDDIIGAKINHAAYQCEELFHASLPIF